MTDPDRISRNSEWHRGEQIDPAAYLVDPG
jgi:hypothetical protein